MNKHMLPIANKPLLRHCIDDLTRAGINDIGIVIGPFGQEIREFFGDGSSVGARITYIYQGDPKGLAHGVLISKSFLKDEPFLLHLGDNLLEEGVSSFVEAFEREPCDCLVGIAEVGNPERFGIVEVENGVPVAFREKPVGLKKKFAVVGIYVFSKNLFKILESLTPSPRGELEITDAIEECRRRGELVKLHGFKGWWKDAGTPPDFLEANALALGECDHRIEGLIEKGANVGNDVTIGRGSIVKKGVTISGPAVIGEDCVLEEDARIGPMVSIGDRARIRGATISDSVILENCEVETKATIFSSIISRNSKIQGSSAALSILLGENSRLSLS